MKTYLNHILTCYYDSWQLLHQQLQKSAPYLYLILLSYEEINNSSGGQKQRSIDIVHQKFKYKADRQVN